jgi:hypothetical protein
MVCFNLSAVRTLAISSAWFTGLVRKSSAHLDAIQPRHHHIQDNKIGWLVSNLPEGLFTTPGQARIVAMPPENEADQGDVLLVIVHDQDLRCWLHGLPLPRFSLVDI